MWNFLLNSILANQPWECIDMGFCPFLAFSFFFIGWHILHELSVSFSPTDISKKIIIFNSCRWISLPFSPKKEKKEKKRGERLIFSTYVAEVITYAIYQICCLFFDHLTLCVNETCLCEISLILQILNC